MCHSNLVSGVNQLLHQSSYVMNVLQIKYSYLQNRSASGWNMHNNYQVLDYGNLQPDFEMIYSARQVISWIWWIFRDKLLSLISTRLLNNILFN